MLDLDLSIRSASGNSGMQESVTVWDAVRSLHINFIVDANIKILS